MIPFNSWKTLAVAAGLAVTSVGCGDVVRTGRSPVFLVINALDAPYHPGLGQLRPAAMERTLVVLDEERQVVGDTSALPCDDEGVKR